MVNSIKSPQVSLKVITTASNFIDPTATTTDWAQTAADIDLTGTIESLKFDAPKANYSSQNYIGQDANGSAIMETYIDSFDEAKISGTMIVNPDADGNYKALDALGLNNIGSSTDSKINNWAFGQEIVPNAQMLLVVGKTYGVRYLLTSFKVSDLDSTDVPEKGIVKVSFEFTAVANDTYKQTVQQ